MPTSSAVSPSARRRQIARQLHSGELVALASAVPLGPLLLLAVDVHGAWMTRARSLGRPTRRRLAGRVPAPDNGCSGFPPPPRPGDGAPTHHPRRSAGGAATPAGHPLLSSAALRVWCCHAGGSKAELAGVRRPAGRPR